MTARHTFPSTPDLIAARDEAEALLLRLRSLSLDLKAYPVIAEAVDCMSDAVDDLRADTSDEAGQRIEAADIERASIADYAMDLSVRERRA